MMSFGDHLEELRRRLLFAILGPIPVLILCLVYGGPILAFIIAPLEDQLARAGQPVRLLATSPVEPFAAYLQVAIAATALISAPWILYQAWLFVAPGLYRHEKRFAYLLFPASSFFTLFAMTFLYYFMLPVMLGFFIIFGSFIVQANPGQAPLPDGLTLPTIPILEADPPDPQAGAMWLNNQLRELRIAAPTADGAATIVFGAPLATQGTIAQQYRVGEYVSLVFGLAIVFALTFQLPIAMLLMNWTGILESKDLVPYRKHALFVCAIVGAVFTPADPGSMLLLMVPLYLLFELGLLGMRLLPATRIAGPLVTDAREGDD